ncbi:MAG: hypothetical protein GX051_01585 [Clostridiales bacterium]|jgi:hypothetical protein|nr:hypothetical protein [Clostridiales bacterium]
MIKGVNKQVVDVNDTGSEYFERAIFFVKPEYSGVSEGKLREKAQLIIDGAGAPVKSKARKQRTKVSPYIKTGILVAAGIAVTVLFIGMFMR